MSDLFFDMPDLFVAEGPIVDAARQLEPSELESVEGAVPRRMREFSTGRLLARTLLERLGVRHPTVPRAPDRSPRWPSGFVGSIAHTDTRCVVAVGRLRDFRAVGVDLEAADPLESDLFEAIVTNAEGEELLGLPEVERGLAVRRLFTAKESVYKCVHPLFETFLEFQEIAISFAPERSTFTATIAHPLASGLEIEGRIVERAGFIHALAVLRARSFAKAM